MTLSLRANDIFSDSEKVYAQALERLEYGDIRDAAEKAWCAAKRATDALILSRTGEEPRSSGKTLQELRKLRRTDSVFLALENRYSICASVLHGACFYDGNCEPEDILIQDIQAVRQYIQEARDLAAKVDY